MAEITFDEPITLEIKEFAGFYYCCEADYNACDSSNAWTPVSLIYSGRAQLLFMVLVFAIFTDNLTTAENRK